MFSWIFLKRSTKEAIITASFVKCLLKKHCLSHTEIMKQVNFRIMKLKIDAYSIFIKVLSEKSYQFLLS